MLMPWFASVVTLKQVGQANAAVLGRLLKHSRYYGFSEGPPTVRDLLFHMPNGMIDRSTLSKIAKTKAGHYAVVEAMILEHHAPTRRRARAPYRIAVEDDSAPLILTYFNVKGDYLGRMMPVGKTRLIGGVIERVHGVVGMNHPDIVAPPERAADILKLAPQYPLTAGLSQRMLAGWIRSAMAGVKPLPEWADAALLKERQWPGFHESLMRLHAPHTTQDISLEGAPRMRLAYDEMLANQLALALVRKTQRRQTSYAIAQDAKAHAHWLAQLPFTLTAGQQQVLAEIAADMRSGARMVRLLQGDVGSGKTILAFGAMVQVVVCGLQSCLMAPTDLLARQHAQTLTPLAEKAGLRLALLTGKLSKGQQRTVREQVASGEVDILIGTHALIEEEVQFQNLALLVVDEQHRFGVGQRTRLAGKGKQPHVLQMTATPIPRSLSMTLYGDMEISSLRELPPGRKPVDTRAVPIKKREAVLEGLGRILAAGERAYWICPLIEEMDEESKQLMQLDLAAAEERFQELSARFPGKVGLVHGRLKPSEREAVMQQFASGEIQLLVATTVVEVGVNVPEATVIVIEHAERFGLAQLHQLRGRVGRSDQQSRCILLYHGALSANASARLKTLCQTNDGFEIAEQDLRLRGAGDRLGEKQTGLPDFLLADLDRHLPLLRVAYDDACLILHRDPDLLNDRGKALRILLALFGYGHALTSLSSA